MISRNLSQRLKRLEARTMPVGDPIAMKIQFVCPVKVVIDKRILTLYGKS